MREEVPMGTGDASMQPHASIYVLVARTHAAADIDIDETVTEATVAV